MSDSKNLSENRQQTKPTVFTFLGVPGSGKSYFARNLAEHTGTIRLSSDAMRLAIFGSREAITKVYKSEERENVNTYVHRAFDYVFGELLKNGHSIICDAHFNKRADRDRLTKIASQYDAQVVLIRVNTPHQVALKRGQEREEADDQRRLSKELMREAIDRHHAGTDAPGSDEIVIEIDGTVTFADQLDSFNRQMEATQ